MSDNNYRAERTITAVFKEEDRVENILRRLLDRGVPRDHLSIMGRNFESQTRITGFITKKDVIFDGLRSGAVFGSLFGTFLSLLTGVGVLFIPFVGSVVAAGPISAVLLGAATGAIAGGAGGGLVSALVALGMPEEKAAIYQTRLKAGDFVMMVEVPAERSGEFKLLLENEGGEEIHVSGNPLPRPCPGRCNSLEDLSPEIRTHLSEDAQQTFLKAYNKAYDETEDEIEAEQRAWSAIRDQYDKDENGLWSKQKVAA